MVFRDHSHRETEPRLALRGEGITANLGRVAWRVGGGTYRQYVTQFDVATTAPNALLPSMRFWLPVDGSTPTPRAHHLAGEFVAQPGVGWEVRTEVYRKWMPVIAALDYGVLLDHSSRLPHQLSPSRFIGTSRGDAWGAGVRIVREIVREGATLPARDAPPPAPVLRAEIGYDYGMSRRTFPSRFGGSLQPTPWNEPHRVTAALDWRPEPLTVVTLRARGAQGRTWALRQAYYDLLAVGDAGAGLPVQAPGASRRPALMTADVGVSRQWRVGGARVDLGAAVLNALDRRNILDYGLQGPNAATTESGYAFVPRYLLGRQWSLTMRVGP